MQQNGNQTPPMIRLTFHSTLLRYSDRDEFQHVSFRALFATVRDVFRFFYIFRLICQEIFDREQIGWSACGLTERLFLPLNFPRLVSSHN